MGYIDPPIHSKRLRNFSFTGWNNPDAYFDENIRQCLIIGIPSYSYRTLSGNK